MILTDVADISFGQAGIYGLLGYAVVFFGLILLMIVMILLGKCFTSSAKKPAVAAPVAAAPVTPAPIADTAAPGSAGRLKLHNVEPKTAAMIMAIVANKLGKPVNELRFLSIKEVDE